MALVGATCSAVSRWTLSGPFEEEPLIGNDSWITFAFLRYLVRDESCV